MKKILKIFILLILTLFLQLNISYAWLKEAEDSLLWYNWNESHDWVAWLSWNKIKEFCDALLILNKNKLNIIKNFSFSNMTKYSSWVNDFKTRKKLVIYSYLYYKVNDLLWTNNNTTSTTNTTSTNDTSNSSLSTWEHVKIAILWDQSSNSSDSQKCLQMVKSEWAELIIHNWDFNYNWDARDKMATKYLWANFPIIWTVWNHDIGKWWWYAKMLERRANASGLKCSWWLYWKKTVCDYKSVRIVTAGPWFSGWGNASFIRDAFKNDNHPWRICHWHYTMPELQTNSKKSRTIWRDIFEAARENWCITTIGHEHAYARTHLLSNMQAQTVVWSNSPYLIKPWQIIHLLVWSSGKRLRPLGSRWKRKNSKGQVYWAKVLTSNNWEKWKWVLFCDINWKKADCYFKSVTWQIVDRFSLISGN
jgi:hypothetical protein